MQLASKAWDYNLFFTISCYSIIMYSWFTESIYSIGWGDTSKFCTWKEWSILLLRARWSSNQSYLIPRQTLAGVCRYKIIIIWVCVSLSFVSFESLVHNLMRNFLICQLSSFGNELDLNDLRESVQQLLRWAWKYNRNLEEQAAQLHMLTGWSQIVEVKYLVIRENVVFCMFYYLST